VPISKEKISIDVRVFSLSKRMKDKLQEECATEGRFFVKFCQNRAGLRHEQCQG
jgi:hypothetical protein